jgi:hypothetical protein
LLPKLKAEELESLDSFEKVWKSLNEAALKLYAISNSEQKVLDAYKKYEAIAQVKEREKCDQRINLAQEIKSLQQKHNLGKEIYVGFVASASPDHRARDLVFIKNYDLNINYFTEDFQGAVVVLKEAFLKLPSTGMITSFEIAAKDVLNPSLINEFRIDKKPELIKSEITMRIRTLATNNLD